MLVLDRKLKQDRDYWIATLRAIERVPHWPVPARRDPAAPCGTLTLDVDGATRHALRDLTKDNTFLCFVALLAALEAVVFRCTGEQTIVVATPPRASEDAAEDAETVLPVLTRLEERLTFRDVLMRVRASLLDAYAHQAYPCDRLAAEGMQAAAQPVFALAAGFKGLHREIPAAAGCGMRWWFAPERDRLSVDIAFDESALDLATMRAIAACWSNVLAAGLANPSVTLDTLDLLDEPQRTLLDRWNATETAVPPGAVPDWVATQAARLPGRIAIVTDTGERLTYAALDAAANQVAHALRARGIGREDRVAVCLSRTPRLVVALLGVWRAGAAYVPLDPSQPQERMRAVVDHAKVRIGLTESVVAPQLPGGCSWIELDVEQTIASQPTAAPAVVLEPANVAYVIYTSGSTGQPKGVQISHGALANCVTALAARPGLSAGDVMLALTTVTFDIAVEELWVPLAMGARIVLVERETVGDRAALAALLEREAVTVVQTVPALWPRLLDAWPGDRRLTLLTGGEPLTARLAGQLAARGPAWNLYGPTETTVWSTVWPVAADRPVRIGTPLANTQVYVLDAQMRRLPTGITGELYIGGAGLARGYWEQPALTARQFVPNPFGPPGCRLYRTGDHARVTPDGVECLGRRDGQVKIRGVRLELGEVEHVLANHPAVAQAVAVARRGQDDSTIGIDAYAVAAAFDRVSAADLESWLRTKLPREVHARVMVLDSLPRLSNGKVDRRALPAHPSSDGPVAPRSEVEAALVRVWSEVLDVRTPGVTDNFFALGGDSLRTIEVVARARAAGWRVTTAQMFEHQTVAALAAVAERIPTGHQGGPAAPAALATLADVRPELVERVLANTSVEA